jgi:hypothetical protein
MVLTVTWVFFPGASGQVAIPCHPLSDAAGVVRFSTMDGVTVPSPSSTQVVLHHGMYFFSSLSDALLPLASPSSCLGLIFD